jgi:hypothetical protein
LNLTPPRAHSRSLPLRLLRAARLDSRTYGEVAADAYATGQALAVVAIVAVTHAVAGAIRAAAFGWSPATAWVFGPVSEFAYWAAGGAATHLAARLAFGSRAGVAQVLRAFGFAAAPGVFILVAALASVGQAGSETAVLPVMVLWRVAASYVATRAALGLGVLQSVVVLAAGIAVGVLAVVAIGTPLNAVLPD